MQKHLKEVIDFRQFTIIVPTNSVFEAMSESKLDALMNNAEKRIAFLKDHIFIGKIGNPSDVNKAIAYSISPNHSVLTINAENNTKMLVDANEQLFQVVQSLPVSEGLVHIVESIK